MQNKFIAKFENRLVLVTILKMKKLQIFPLWIVQWWTEQAQFNFKIEIVHKLSFRYISQFDRILYISFHSHSRPFGIAIVLNPAAITVNEQPICQRFTVGFITKHKFLFALALNHASKLTIISWYHDGTRDVKKMLKLIFWTCDVNGLILCRTLGTIVNVEMRQFQLTTRTMNTVHAQLCVFILRIECRLLHTRDNFG